MAKGSNALLVLDFDNTVTNEHMHNAFFKLEKVDFNPTQNNAVTDDNIRRFIEATEGIKNEENLKPVLQFAISKGIEVNIASFTGYPNAVRRVVKNHLGLPEKQAENISVFGGFPQDYDVQLQGLSVRKQQDQVGKNLHICKAIVEYKDKHGQLPKTVMLVDDTKINIENIEKFVEVMSKREGWLKENGLNIKDINNIEFKGVRVPKEKNSRIVEGVDYLKEVQEFISANLVQEPIYENLKKEEPIYQNLPQLPPEPGFNTKNAPTLPPKSENSEAKLPLPPTKSKLNTVHVANGKSEKQVHTKNISLRKQIKKIQLLLQEDNFPEIVTYNICSVFKEKVMIAIKEQGYIVSSAKGRSEVTIEGSNQIGDEKIITDSFTQIMAQIQEKKKEMKDFANEDPQLREKISELLNVNLQKKTDINSNYVARNQPERQQAASFPRRYIKVTQDKNTGSSTSERDKREKGKKTDLGSKILNYVPWRTALTLAAFAIPVAGPIAGTAIGAFMYGNYRNNNRTENSAAKKENRAESAKPSLTKEFLFRAGTIAIGFLFGGPIGVVIALGIVAVDVISNGKLIQGAEKVLDAGYDALSAVGEKFLNVGKTAFSKIKETQELSKRDIEVSDPNHSSNSHVTSEDEPKAKSQVEAELKRRASAASQEHSAEGQISRYR
ncbi:hypothetical protein [Wolbachia endosymbiont of Oedothorax gibbosus]|uniref:hypothetical protein n=1 Tax=Wolbachia endosymbiont of Oedothorax gibbosus TaxID=931100 RepID=UPI002024CA8E|nr:hypothetical protein [Wolbachia endosymbiont of Oedothorax gibbosus]